MPPLVIESRLRRGEKPASKSSQFLLQRRLEGPGGSKEAGGISTAAKQPEQAAEGPGLLEMRGWCKKSRNRGKEFFHGCIFTGSISPRRAVALPPPYSTKLLKCISNQIEVASGSTASIGFV